MNRFKKKWNISSNNQLLMIFVVFAVNGSLSAVVNRYILNLLEITKSNLPLLSYCIIYFIFISIIYFALLSITSKIFGQGLFFKNFAKKSLKPIGLDRFIL